MMFKALRRSVAILAIPSMTVLCACSAQNSTAGTAPASSVAGASFPIFSLNTPVETIAADQRGKAVLDRDLPGLMHNSKYVLFEDMSLSQIAVMSGGRLTKSKLDQVQRDLTEMSANEMAAQ
jgi:hypothetical protein